MSRLLVILCILLGGLGAAAADARSTRLACVVFGGELAVVDIERARVVRRLDFIRYLKPADRVELSAHGKELRIAGNAARGRYGVLRLAVPRMTVSSFEQLRELPDLPIGAKAPADDRGFDLAASEMAGKTDGSGRVHITLRRRSTGRIVGEAEFDVGSEDSPYERFETWAVTADCRRIVVVTSGGIRYQSYMRIFDVPSMRLAGTVPLMKVHDDNPVDLILLADAVRRPLH